MLKLLRQTKSQNKDKTIYKSLNKLTENVSCDLYERACYSEDAGPIRFGMPDFIVQPINEKEIQDILRLANERLIPVYVRGGVPRSRWGNAVY